MHNVFCPAAIQNCLKYKSCGIWRDVGSVHLKVTAYLEQHSTKNHGCKYMRSGIRMGQFVDFFTSKKLELKLNAEKNNLMFMLRC